MLHFQLLSSLEKWQPAFTVHPRSHWTPEGPGKRRKKEKGAGVLGLIQRSPREKSIPQGELIKNYFMQAF